MLHCLTCHTRLVTEWFWGMTPEVHVSDWSLVFRFLQSGWWSPLFLSWGQKGWWYVCVCVRAHAFSVWTGLTVFMKKLIHYSYNFCYSSLPIFNDWACNAGHCMMQERNHWSTVVYLCTLLWRSVHYAYHWWIYIEIKAVFISSNSWRCGTLYFVIR
jgi:hypothetical protein